MMLGRKFVRIVFSVSVVLALSACVFTIEDGDGNAYAISWDGKVSLSGVGVDNVNTLRFRVFLPSYENAPGFALTCRTGDGDFVALLQFDRPEDEFFPAVDTALYPDTFSELLKTTCAGTYDAGTQTYAYELAIIVNEPESAYLAIITPVNIACILDYLNSNEELVLAADFCLQADPRESTYDWGIKDSPTPVNILTLVLDEATVDLF